MYVDIRVSCCCAEEASASSVVESSQAVGAGSGGSSLACLVLLGRRHRRRRQARAELRRRLEGAPQYMIKRQKLSSPPERVCILACVHLIVQISLSDKYYDSSVIIFLPYGILLSRTRRGLGFHKAS